MMQQWINDERTVLVRTWDGTTLEVATRTDPGAVWGPPVTVTPDLLLPIRGERRTSPAPTESDRRTG